MGTVEPVFANIQNKGMRRFTLRGQEKVSAQWKLFTIVHNIEKVATAMTPHRKNSAPAPSAARSSHRNGANGSRTR